MSPALCHRSFARLLLIAAVLLMLVPAARGWAQNTPGSPSSSEQTPGEAPEATSDEGPPIDKDVTQGALRMKRPDGSLVECPLVNTQVVAEVSGFLARATVTQTFHNPTDEKIEAVYVFPLPHEAAVDGMTMRIGDRKIVGLIQRRDAARQIYEQALLAGQTAALLEQERPNIFTQSVGNIEPGQVVKIEISYVDVLKYDMGTYEFHFPMVVGPRFIPGRPTSSPQPRAPEQQGKVSPPVANTDRVPDATRISPPVLRPGFRNGHDIELTVHLDAGVPIQGLRVLNHKSQMERDGDHRATITLARGDSIPNKDFVLRYDVVGKEPEMAVLGHTGEYTDSKRLGEGYFMLMVQPSEDESLKQMPPREIVFLVDTSGSMNGQPTAKVREAMQGMLELCREKDTVQVITFASQAFPLFDKPVPVNGPNIAKAVDFARGLRGAGGTHMLEGVKMAIDQPIDRERMRIVVMLTDGYIGNEAEIIKHVGEHCGDQIRFWAIGIGSSPNMFLVDGVARQGGGMGKRLGLDDDTAALTQEVMNRIQRAQLAKIQIDWGDLQVAETYPARLPELWAGRPVIVLGRYRGGGSAEITVSGLVEGEATSWPLVVTLPGTQPDNDVLAKAWARWKIEDLMQQSFYTGSPAVEEEVTAIALDYKLMSQYTSFVAVDASKAGEIQEPARPPRRMTVPVPLPEGTRYEGFFGPVPGSEEPAEFAMLGDQFGRLKESFQRKSGSAVLPAHRRNQALAYFGRQAGQAGTSLRGLGLANQPASALPATSTGPYTKKYAPQPSAPQVANGLRGRGGYYRAPTARGVNRLSAARWGGIPMGGGGAGGYAAGPLGLDGLSTSFSRDGRRLVGQSLAEEEVRRESLYASQALRAEAAPLAKRAAESLQEAAKLESDGKPDAARSAYTRAFFLDQAAVNFGGSGGQVAQQAILKISELRAEQLKRQIEALPALNDKLDLVLRDVSLAEALQRIGNASSATIDLVPGSVNDAAALLLEEPRISYLDLRQATLAEALEWTLSPANLDWRVSRGRIVVASARREAGESSWVYDVSEYAVPTKAELGDFKDQGKAVKASSRIAASFLAAVRSELEQSDSSIAWYGPGQLLVMGDRQLHQSVGQFLANLADKSWVAAGKHAEVLTAARQRAAGRQASLRDAEQRRRRREIAVAHDRYGPQLLAAAAGGELDLEALTELQIAWRRPETAELLDGEAAVLALKSCWMVWEAARALPEATELQTLAEMARQRTREAADRAASNLEEKPEDAVAYATALYAALALRDDASYQERVLPLLTKARKEESALSAARLVAAALLKPTAQIDRGALLQVVAEGPVGDDMVLLMGLAARRAGGEVWRTFRENTRTQLGEQPLTGHIIVLVNRLEGAPLAVVQNSRS